MIRRTILVCIGLLTGFMVSKPIRAAADPMDEWRSSPREGISQIRRGGRYGAEAVDGTLILPCEYDFVSTFAGGVAFVKLGTHAGVIDRTGRFVVPLEHELLYQPSPLVLRHPLTQAAVVVRGSTDGGYTLARYDRIAPRAGSPWGWPVRVERAGKLGYLGSDGSEILPVLQDRIEESVAGAWVTRGGKVGLFHTGTRRFEIPQSYDAIERTHLWPKVVKAGGHVGLLGDRGKLLLPVEYDEIEEVAAGPRRVVREGRIGIVDHLGRGMVPFVYDELRFDHEQVPLRVAVRTADRWGLVDGRGRILLAPAYAALDGPFGEIVRVRRKSGGPAEYLTERGVALGFASHARLVAVRAPSQLAAAVAQASPPEPSDPRVPRGQGALQIIVLPRAIPYLLHDGLRKSIREHMTVFLVNRGDQTISPMAQDGAYELVQEALDEHGAWRQIEHWDPSTCGNSYFPVSIAPGEQRIAAARRYAGPRRTQLRIGVKLEGVAVYSAPFQGSIDPAQFVAAEAVESHGD